MNFPIRGAVIHNVQDMSPKELHNMVNDSIERGEEKLLPGLGVLFEVIWENCDQTKKDELIDTLHNNMPREQAQPPLSPS
ncbi:small acid-soluble spore protein SspI [Desmospora profundinema]|uniref:Small, acid-soluble spore protein I n=1 Tax=Desmospora profundinema TaxID=1571184 RepID=A0ABU1IP21_9BACL|nr:small acid-soluble spore protein SspI [Desmospora profundinema]MDR6226531.1 small acid-soluble spore protein I (minor) [Desmospora profundinema]